MAVKLPCSAQKFETTVYQGEISGDLSTRGVSGGYSISQKPRCNELIIAPKWGGGGGGGGG